MEKTIKYKVDSENIVSEVFESEVVIINLDNGNYFSYEGAGVEIWKCLQSETNVKQIEDYLTVIYPNTPKNDLVKIVTDSLGDLLKENLIIEDSKGPNTINNKEDNELVNQVITKSAFSTPSLQKFTDMKEFLLVDPIHEVDYQKWPEKVEKN